MTRIRIPSLKCRRCFHEWVPRQADVRLCPRCKSAAWNVPLGDRKPSKRAAPVEDLSSTQQ